MEDKGKYIEQTELDSFELDNRFLSLRVGDKLYCKKDLYNWFEEDDWYVINFIDLSDDCITLYDKYGDGVDFFERSRHTNQISARPIWDYFYTIKEYRKLKLKRIANV